MATLEFNLELEETQPSVLGLSNIVNGINVIYYLVRFAKENRTDVYDYFRTPLSQRLNFLESQFTDGSMLLLTELTFGPGSSSKAKGKVSSQDKESLDRVGEIMRKLNEARENTRGKSINEKREVAQSAISDLLPLAPIGSAESVQNLVAFLRLEHATVFTDDSIKSLVVETD